MEESPGEEQNHAACQWFDIDIVGLIPVFVQIKSQQTPIIRLPLFIEIENGSHNPVGSILKAVEMLAVEASRWIESQMTLKFKQAQKECPIDGYAKYVKLFEVVILDMAEIQWIEPVNMVIPDLRMLALLFTMANTGMTELSPLP